MNLDLSKLNLTSNPFEDFELLEETLDKETVSQHNVLFKDREEITKKLLLGITTSTSYKVVLHGEAGVGKSSLLNKVLHDLRQRGYFAIKYRVTEASALDANLFERELLRTFGEEIAREASRSKSFRDRLKSIIILGTKRDLRQLSLLAVLYSSGQVTIREGQVETDGLSMTVGIPVLKAEVSEQEQKHIEITRVETLSHLVFGQLLRDGIGLLKELNYRGVVIAIDEIDKLEEKLEGRLLTIVKDTFYPAGLCHLLLVMKTRNGRKPIHPDIFVYEPVHSLPKRYVFEFLEEMYRAKAIDKKKPLTSLLDKRLFDELYDKNRGIIRMVLKDLSACVIGAILTDKSRIDDHVYQRTKVTDALQAYLMSLRPDDREYKILSYLLKTEETYTRDEDLSKATELSKSALSYKLRDLEERGILVSRKRGSFRIFSIDPSLRARVKSIIR
ncbi:AAA family ATPase [Candidatus Bathyarchaeota archaeon]|nr:AAA family ATPase [Candidatus Bathyarchaeota archaeon]